MIGFCLGVAFNIIESSFIPSDTLTLSWIHSVEKTRWEEVYTIKDSRLSLVSARIQSFGAGMEPPADAVFQNGWWIYQLKIGSMEKIALTYSNYTEDYSLCWNNQCAALSQLVGTEKLKQTRIELFPCTRRLKNN